MHRLLLSFIATAMLTLSLSSLAAECDAETGKQLFQTRCGACHALQEDRVGPHLTGVVGRPIGKVRGFTYSTDLASAKGSWSLEQLDRWLTAPARLFPETSMAFGGLRKPEERQAVLCFLQRHG